ncbi:MAG: hypothetical protein ABIH39_03050 [Candidatus Margulisiibacteriota bacterium]
MKHFTLFYVLVLFLLFIGGCSQTPESPVVVNITSISDTPLEADILADDTDGDGQIKGYHAEEITVKLTAKSVGSSSSSLLSSQATGVTITSYSVNYTLLDGVAGTIPAFPDGSTSIYIKAGESGEYPLRGVSFTQKTWVLATFGAGTAVNVRADLTLYGHDDFGNSVTITGSFDIIFTNLAEPSE